MSVVVAHWLGLVAEQNVPAGVAAALHGAMLDYFSPGRLGVVAFFCVSGFVIPFSFRGQRPLSGFLISRVFRLYPVYWIACLLTLLVMPAVVGPISTFGLIANATMLTKFLGQPYILGVAWTLTMELVFYGICFLAFSVRILHSARFNLAAITFFVATALGMAGWRWAHPSSHLPAQFATFLAAMHFGTLVRLWLVEDNARAARFAPYAAMVLLVGISLANGLGYWRTNETEVGVIAITASYAVGVALFLWCAMRGRFAGPRTVALGGISYSLYLIHPLVLGATLPLWQWLGPWWVAAAVLTIVNLLGSVLISYAMFKMIEVPAQNAGRRIVKAWGGRSSPTSSAMPAVANRN